MKHSIISFHALNIPVKNIKLSIDFFQRLGFYISDTESTMLNVSVYMKQSEKSDFRICLQQYLVDDSKIEQNNWLEFIANPESGFCHEDVFDMLQEDGVVFLNMAHKDKFKVICGVGMMKDPDGNDLRLVDHTDYNEYD